jgi:chemotaxis-related protein WspB
MLFLLFQIGAERYALDSRKIVQVLPLVKLNRLPQAPRGVAGVFLYRGSPVPAVDLSDLTLGQPAAELLSTRIIVMDFAGPGAKTYRLGLIAERATEVLRKESTDFVSSGISLKAAPYLGPVLKDPAGTIQWVQEQHLLSGPMQQLLFNSAGLMDLATTAVT